MGGEKDQSGRRGKEGKEQEKKYTRQTEWVTDPEPEGIWGKKGVPPEEKQQRPARMGRNAS